MLKLLYLNKKKPNVQNKTSIFIKKNNERNCNSNKCKCIRQMLSEGILIYFYADRFETHSVTYINAVNKSFLVQYLQHSIR